MVDLDAPVNYAVVGQVIGVSRQAVSDLSRKSGFSGSTNGQLILALFQRYRDQAGGRGGDSQAALTEVKTRRELAAARRDELQYHRDISSLVAVDAIEPLLNNWATVAQAEFTAALDRIVSGVEGKHKIEIDQGLIDGPIESAYSAIASFPSRAAAVRAAGGDPDDAVRDAGTSRADLATAPVGSDAAVVAG